MSSGLSVYTGGSFFGCRNCGIELREEEIEQAVALPQKHFKLFRWLTLTLRVEAQCSQSASPSRRVIQKARRLFLVFGAAIFYIAQPGVAIRLGVRPPLRCFMADEFSPLVANGKQCMSPAENN